jgi:integrase
MYESYFKTSMRHAALLVPREEGGATDRQRDRGHTPKFSIHALRHWAISSWLLDGVAIPRVAQWAGHASPMVTMKVYARVIEGMEQQEADRQKLEMNGARLLGQSRLLEGPQPEFLLTRD